MSTREYYQRHKEKLREYNRTYLKKWRLANPLKPPHSPEWLKEHRKTKEYKVKMYARQAVRRQIKLGNMLPQTCEVTGCTVKGQAHHPDYSKKLEVRWLCVQHHVLEHHPRLNNVNERIDDATSFQSQRRTS